MENNKTIKDIINEEFEKYENRIKTQIAYEVIKDIYDQMNRFENNDDINAKYVLLKDYITNIYYIYDKKFSEVLKEQMEENNLEHESFVEVKINE